MKALTWHGKERHSLRKRARSPASSMPRDAIIKVTACAICGSDLHIFNGIMPEHGERRRAGPRDDGRSRRGRRGEQGAQGRRPGRGALHHLLRRVLLLQNGLLLGLRALQSGQGQRPSKLWGHSPAGLFGYTHLLGGYRGRPGRVSARALCRCRPDQGAGRPVRRAGAVPVGHLSDRLHGGRFLQHPAGGHDRRSGAAGRSASSPSSSAFMLGAARVIAIDTVPSGWRWPGSQARSPSISWKRTSTTASWS